MTTQQERLEYLRGELRAERISYGELAELQGLAPFIAEDDTELREAAGIPEHSPQRPQPIRPAIPGKFIPQEIEGLEWQKIVSRTTQSGCWRVEITWALDRFRITVVALHSAFGEGRVVAAENAWFVRTAITKANRLLRRYEVKK